MSVTKMECKMIRRIYPNRQADQETINSYSVWIAKDKSGKDHTIVFKNKIPPELRSRVKLSVKVEKHKL